MEQFRQRKSETNHLLRREAVLPSSTAPARPCLLVGLSLVALCLAASLDAFLWHQSQERESAEIYQEEARAQTRTMSFELSDLRRSGQTQKALADATMTKLRTLEQKVSKVCQNLPRDAAHADGTLAKLCAALPPVDRRSVIRATSRNRE